MFSFVIITLTLSSISWCFSRDLPPYFPKCSTNDLEFDECVLKAFNTLRPYTHKGVKDIGLPSLNPLVISKITLNQESQAVNYTTMINNYTIEGMDNYDIKEFHYDSKTMTIRGKIDFESLPMSGLYEAVGHVVGISIHGKGNGRAVYGSIKASFEIKGEMKQKKGVDYYHPNSVKVRLTIDDSGYNLEGLFVNEELARVANNMLNSNSKLATEAVTPVLERIAEIGIMKFMKSLTRSIPYNGLFPPIK